MINDTKYKSLKKGDKVVIHNEDSDGVRTLERVEVLKVYPYGKQGAPTPFIVDVEGEFYSLEFTEELYVDKYGDGIPNADHVYWLADATLGGVAHDVIHEYAYRYGHPGNDVWEHHGERITTEELLGRVAGQKLMPLDSRY